MSGVTTRYVATDEAGMRLDRWFKRHFPQVPHTRLQKLLRTGQVRVDGGRARAGLRLDAGQTIRVPPLGDDPPPPKAARAVSVVSDEDGEALRQRILHRDDHVLVIDKPAGLAVQGGSGTRRHLDGMLDALRFGSPDRPRLVHRLDKDTSGVLVLARNPNVAAKLADAFRTKAAQKLYWAVVVGIPRPADGIVNVALAKLPGRQGEKVVPDDEAGKKALTFYRTIERAGRNAAWIALEPQTGRTHQLRAHCLVVGTPILGDGKYGGQEAFLDSYEVSRKLHLHSRALRIPHPQGGILEISAPLPDHMRATWRLLGFDEGNEEAGFA
jgi:23S rRNA pseudouridine955/2504/2580 synthase